MGWRVWRVAERDGTGSAECMRTVMKLYQLDEELVSGNAVFYSKSTDVHTHEDSKHPKRARLV